VVWNRSKISRLCPRGHGRRRGRPRAGLRRVHLRASHSGVAIASRGGRAGTMVGNAAPSAPRASPPARWRSRRRARAAAPGADRQHRAARSVSPAAGLRAAPCEAAALATGHVERHDANAGKRERGKGRRRWRRIARPARLPSARRRSRRWTSGGWRLARAAGIGQREARPCSWPAPARGRGAHDGPPQWRDGRRCIVQGHARRRGRRNARTLAPRARAWSSLAAPPSAVWQSRRRPAPERAPGMGLREAPAMLLGCVGCAPSSGGRPRGG
jgi:hypothetical protein